MPARAVRPMLRDLSRAGSARDQELLDGQAYSGDEYAELIFGFAVAPYTGVSEDQNSRHDFCSGRPAPTVPGSRAAPRVCAELIDDPFANGVCLGVGIVRIPPPLSPATRLYCGCVWPGQWQQGHDAAASQAGQWQRRGL